MRPVRIDFSGRSRALALDSHRTAHRIAAALLVIGVVMLASGAAVAWKLSQKTTQVNETAARLQAARDAADPTANAQAVQLSPDDAELVAGAVAGLNYPWANIMSNLERSLTPGVSMISIELGVARQSVKMVIDAPDIDHAIPYVDGIRHDPMFAQVTLVKQEVVNLGDNVTAMRFTLEAPTTAPVGASRGEAAR